jgi:hypothetical protein
MMNPPKYARFPATLQASPSIRPEREMSVSEQMRLAREALARPAVRDQLLTSFQPVPVTGQYYDVIRATQQVRTSAPPALTNAFVRGINNKAGGVKSFAAAGYNYPSGQMVIGAALAGMPCPSCGSPSEDRKAQMAGLLGLGAAAEASDLAQALEEAKSILDLLSFFGLSLPAVEIPTDPARVCDFRALLDASIAYLKRNPKGIPASCASIKQDVSIALDMVADAEGNPVPQGLTERVSAAKRGLACMTSAMLLVAPMVGNVCPVKGSGQAAANAANASSAAANAANTPPVTPPVALTDRAKARLRTIRARTAPQRTITLPASRSGRTFVFNPNAAPPAVEPSASSNTMLIVGGIAAAAAAFFLLRKK